MRTQVRVLPILVVAASVASAPGAARAGTADTSPGPATGPAFSAAVLEMTKGTVERFAKALAAEDAARRSIAARAAAGQPKARMSKEEYQQCQMNAVMSPEYMKLVQDASQAASSATGPEAQRKALEGMTASMQAFMEKQCGPDPSAEAKGVDVAGEMRRAQADAAKENGFNERQYAVLKERISPLCLTDPPAPGGDALRLPGDGNVFYVYTSAEVAAVRPRCEAFLKSLYPKTR